MLDFMDGSNISVESLNQAYKQFNIFFIMFGGYLEVMVVNSYFYDVDCIDVEQVFLNLLSEFYVVFFESLDFWQED